MKINSISSVTHLVPKAPKNNEKINQNETSFNNLFSKEYSLATKSLAFLGRRAERLHGDAKKIDEILNMASAKLFESINVQNKAKEVQENSKEGLDRAEDVRHFASELYPVAIDIQQEAYNAIQSKLNKSSTGIFSSLFKKPNKFKFNMVDKLGMKQTVEYEEKSESYSLVTVTQHLENNFYRQFIFDGDFINYTEGFTDGATNIDLTLSPHGVMNCVLWKNEYLEETRVGKILKFFNNDLISYKKDIVYSNDKEKSEELYFKEEYEYSRDELIRYRNNALVTEYEDEEGITHHIGKGKEFFGFINGDLAYYEKKQFTKIKDSPIVYFKFANKLLQEYGETRTIHPVMQCGKCFRYADNKLQHFQSYKIKKGTPGTTKVECMYKDEDGNWQLK